MSRYTKVKVNISQGQIGKIKRAIQAESQVSIRLLNKDLSGEDVLAFTQTQVNKLKNVHQNGTGVRIKMSKTQLKHNAEIQGRFLQLILPALATVGKFLASSVLLTLATGALAGIGQAAGSTAVNKIAGSGVVYWKKNGLVCKIRKSGQGLFLSPWQKGSSLGDRLFQKSRTGYVDGSGLLLGPNSQFQNIPILEMLL